jgi:hypothetical protein
MKPLTQSRFLEMLILLSPAAPALVGMRPVVCQMSLPAAVYGRGSLAKPVLRQTAD